MCPNAICLSVGLPTSHSLIPFKTLIKRDSDLRSFCCLVLVNPCLLQTVESFSFSVEWAEEINYLEHSGKSFLNFSTPYTCQVITAPNLKGRERSHKIWVNHSQNRLAIGRSPEACLTLQKSVTLMDNKDLTWPPPPTLCSTYAAFNGLWRLNRATDTWRIGAG